MFRRFPPLHASRGRCAEANLSCPKRIFHLRFAPPVADSFQSAAGSWSVAYHQSSQTTRTEQTSQAVLLTPEQLLRQRLKELPPDFANVALNGLSLLSWMALPISFISWLADLRAAMTIWTDFYDRLVALRPVFDAMAAALTPVVIWWRDFTHPVREMFVAVVPPWVPFEAAEVVLMLLLAIPPALQFLRSRSLLNALSVGLEQNLRELRDLESSESSHDRS